MIEAQGDFNRAVADQLVRIRRSCRRSRPSRSRLTADPPARVADVACGVGWAAIAIALAYPNVQWTDLDSTRRRSTGSQGTPERLGVADRVFVHGRGGWDRSGSPSVRRGVIIEPSRHGSSRWRCWRRSGGCFDRAVPCVAVRGNGDAFDGRRRRDRSGMYFGWQPVRLPAGGDDGATDGRDRDSRSGRDDASASGSRPGSQWWSGSTSRHSRRCSASIC